MKSCNSLPLLLMLAVLLCVTACRPASSSRDEARPLVFVSIEPLRYFADALAGSRFEVRSFVPADCSPENFEPTPQQVVSLSEASAFIKVGRLGFEETWLPRLADLQPALPIFGASDSLLLHEDAASDVALDPHTWTSPQSAAWIVRSMCAAFCRIDPEGASFFCDRRDSLLLRIAEVDRLMQAELRPVEGRAFVVAHPALTRLAAAYGLRQLSIERNGQEPSPSLLAEIIDEARREGVVAVLVQEEVSHNAVRAVCDELGAQPVGIQPLAYDWPSQMLHIARVISHAVR